MLKSCIEVEQNNYRRSRMGGTGEEEKRGRRKGDMIRYGRRLGRCTEGHETEQSRVARGNGELGLATRKSQMPEK